MESTTFTGSIQAVHHSCAIQSESEQNMEMNTLRTSKDYDKRERF